MTNEYKEMDAVKYELIGAAECELSFVSDLDMRPQTASFDFDVKLQHRAPFTSQHCAFFFKKKKNP